MFRVLGFTGTFTAVVPVAVVVFGAVVSGVAVVVVLVPGAGVGVAVGAGPLMVAGVGVVVAAGAGGSVVIGVGTGGKGFDITPAIISFRPASDALWRYL